MARPKEFDEQDALLKAMAVFWRQGFDGASMQDLLAATGLSRSSLYETFGDKATLFEAATKLYFEMHGEPRVRALTTASSAREGLLAFFGQQIDACTHPALPPGCLITNTATTLESHDPRIAQLVRDSTDALRKEIRRLLKRGQDAGEVSPDVNLDDAAQMLMGVSMGLNVMARIDNNAKSLRAMARSAVEAVCRPAARAHSRR